MTWTVVLTKRAVKDLKPIPRPAQERIRTRIDALAEDPFAADSSALQGAWQGYRRVRVGDYRIIYCADAKVVTVTIVRVMNRQEDYGGAPR